MPSDCLRKFGIQICERKNYARKISLRVTFSLLFMTGLKRKLRTELSPSVISYKPVCFNMDCTGFENHQSSETVSYLEIALIFEYLTP